MDKSKNQRFIFFHRAGLGVSGSNERPANNYIAGFFSTLIRIATEEDKSKDEEDIIP